MKNMDSQLFLNKPGLLHILKEYYPETLLSM
jgi:hypothetical protein